MVVVAITGGSAGLGASMAVQLAKTGGFKVALIARRREKLDEVVAACGGDDHALAVVADVCKREEVQAAVATIVKELGTIDVWVNNAGRGLFVQPSELTDEMVADMMQVNVMSAIYGMQSVLPVFQEKREGLIVNVSSLLGRMAHIASFRSAYAGAKHFLNGIHYAFKAEVQSEYPGIAFSLASPGVIATDFGLNAKGPDSRSLPNAQDTDECAAVIVKSCIAQRQAEVYTHPAHEDLMRKHLQSLVPE